MQFIRERLPPETLTTVIKHRKLFFNDPTYCSLFGRTRSNPGPDWQVKVRKFYSALTMEAVCIGTMSVQHRRPPSMFY